MTTRRIDFLTRTQAVLGLLLGTCFIGAGVRTTVDGSAKQSPHAPLPVAMNGQAAAVALSPELRKEGTSVTIDAKILAKLAEQLRSKNWEERSAALATLE